MFVFYPDLGTHLLSAGGDRIIHLWNPFKVNAEDKGESVVSGATSEAHVCSFKGAHAYDVLQLDVYVSHDIWYIFSIFFVLSKDKYLNLFLT